MKNVIITLVIVIGITASLALAVNKGQSDQATVLDASAASTLSAETVVYDVRTPAEFADSHAEGATLLPLADIQRGVYPDEAKDAPIAIYCRSGNRSAEATTLLEKAGFTNITDMGGLSDIEAYGLRLTTS